MNTDHNTDHADALPINKCADILGKFETANAYVTYAEIFDLYNSLGDDDVDALTHIQYVLISLFEAHVHDNMVKPCNAT